MSQISLRYQAKHTIRTVAELAAALGETEEALRALMAQKSVMYPVLKTVGPRGLKKVFYRPEKPIKDLHRKIINEILKHVEFPQYLNGGIRARNYIDNCNLHVQSKVIINLDISRFFESITENEIKKVWLELFKFSTEVAEVLSALTTYRGYLPRGAPASTYLANMIFWDLEPYTEEKLRSYGFVYSRYIDDVCISSKRYIVKPKLSEAIRVVYGMFAKRSVKPNRLKEVIHYADNKGVFVHRTNVSKQKPTMRKAVRRIIRAEVHNFVKGDDRLPLNRVRGRVGWMQQLEPERAKVLFEKLPLKKPE